MAGLEAFGLTDQGRRREQNEDAFDVVVYADNPSGGLFVVADGMGGYAAGEVASELAIKQITTTFRSTREGTLAERLERAVQDANVAIAQAGQDAIRRGMGSTVVCAAIEDGFLISAHVGDSRLYRLRGQAIERLTRDHSLVQARVDSGLMTMEEAEAAGNRNIVTRALGMELGVEVELGEHTVEPGDRYLLCSDGLAGMVRDREMRHIAGTMAPEAACRQLIDLANDRGGPDNITVVIVAVAGEPGSTDGSNHGEPATQEMPAVSPGADDAPPGLDLSTVQPALLAEDDRLPVAPTATDRATVFGLAAPVDPLLVAAPRRGRRARLAVVVVGAIVLLLVAIALAFLLYRLLSHSAPPPVPRTATPVVAATPTP